MRRVRWTGRGLVPLAVVLLVQGCVAPSPKSGVPPPPAPAAAEESPYRTQGSVAPVAVLMREAQAAQRAGRLEEAAANLERAVRIDPYDAKLWQLLAAIRLEQGDAAQAEAMAARSNSMASDPDTQRENWFIIAQARRRQGDEAGARAADHRAREYAPF